MRILASIDIGSNTILLLVAKISRSGRLVPILEGMRTPRLAFGLKKTGRISDKNLGIAVEAISEFRENAINLGAEKIYASATQAVRIAANRKEVVKTILEKTGVKVEVISGKREAELTYLGAVTGMGRLNKRRIMFDIGGASTEFVQAEEDRIVRAISLPIGAVEITEKYRTDLKTSADTIKKIEMELEGDLEGRVRGFREGKFDLIGTGGTISTCKLLDMRPAGFDPSSVHGRTLKLSRLEELIHDMSSLKLSERKRVITFDPERANVIVAGGLILKSILGYFGKRTVKVSTRNLRWGFLMSKL